MFILVVPTRIGKGRVSLTDSAKELKVFSEIASIEKKKLLVKRLGTKVDES